MVRHHRFVLLCTLVNALLLSVQAQIPPVAWQEHWFEHNQLLKRVYYNDDVAIYYDPDMDRSITWPNRYETDLWGYVKSVYGNFGSENRLYCIYHQGKYGGGHPSTYFDDSHDYRNVTDCGPGPWNDSTGWNLDVVTHECGHIVEGASNGVHGSPAFSLWGDSKWMEIFIYDVYVNLGKTSEAQRWYNQMQTQTDNFPVANAQWFKNWFYPIWNDYGGNKVLAKFFELLAQNFPKNGVDYARDINWGEFVHFWSGAAGVSLKGRAKIAFGWPSEWQSQFTQAQKDFPNVEYGSTGIESEQGGMGHNITNPRLDQNYPNPFNPSTSIKYQLFEPGEVRLKVFDVLGREVATLVEGFTGAGYHSAIWKAENLSSGVYFCVLKVRQNNSKLFLQTKSMLFAK